MTEANMEQEIEKLRGQIAGLERQLRSRTGHWPQLEKTCRGIAILFVVAGVAAAVAGAIFTYLERPNSMIPIALSFGLATITLGLLGQALRSQP
jgi:hypothetical protein